jgi:pimeloyl-ACP methyl ester carboxylesterase
MLGKTHLSEMNKAQLKAYFDSWVALYGEYVNADFQPNIKYGADVWKITYCTVDFNGQPTIASGVVSLPVGGRFNPLPNRLSTVAYQHGTSVSNFDTVSNLNVNDTFDGPTPLAFFTGAGFIYIAPDYLAYGDSQLPRHRYFHAASEASASADMLTAAKELPAYQAAKTNNKLFLFGFSQGGHVSMALQRSLEAQNTSVTAHATIGGVYDPEAWFLKSVFDPEGETPQYISLYISFLTVAYDDVYNIYNNVGDAFKPAVASEVEGLLDMQHTFDDAAFSLPPTSTALLENSWRDSLQNDPQMPLRVRLRENQVYQWQPQAPVKFFHSVEDDEVDYTLAQTTYNYMNTRGAPISFSTLNGYNHLSSWHHAIPQAIEWFKTF